VILTAGNKVIYPRQGLCLIISVVRKVIDGAPIKFYHLTLLDEKGGELYVPVDKAQAIGLRRLLKKSEIPKLMGQFKQAVEAARNWKQRYLDNLKMLASGSAFDLAEVVESLTGLNETKKLSPHDSWMLERARKLLVCEISEVMGETKSVIEEKLDQALKARKGEMRKEENENYVNDQNGVGTRSGAGVERPVYGAV